MLQRVALLILCSVLGIGIGLFLNKLKKDDVDLAAKVAVKQAIKEDPKLVLDLLKENAEDLFDIVLEGQNVKREKSMRAQQEAQLKKPLKPEIDTTRPMAGAANAPVTVVIFSDFQCPYCSKAALTFHQVMEKYKGKVRVFFKHMIIRSHLQAPMAAAYFEAVGMQSVEKAWAFHDLAFANQEALKKDGEEFLRAVAKSLDLNMEKLELDVKSKEVLDRIARDREESEKLDVQGAPTFIINGVAISGAVSFEEFNRVVDMVLDYMKKSNEQGSGQAPSPEPAKQSPAQPGKQ